MLKDYIGKIMIAPEKLRDGNLKDNWNDDVGCKNWSNGLCVDKTLPLFHDLLDGTISFEEKKFEIFFFFF